METRQPHAWSAPGSALPRLAAPDLPDTSEPPWTVLLWDPRPARLQVVSRLIAACGARLRCNDEVSAIPQVESSRGCALAVVALGACPSPGDLGVEAIRSLKQKGFKVICYADGAPSWPLQRTLPALSGWRLLVTGQRDSRVCPRTATPPQHTSSRQQPADGTKRNASKA